LGNENSGVPPPPPPPNSIKHMVGMEFGKIFGKISSSLECLCYT
jgi:hypothetical protein